LSFRAKRTEHFTGVKRRREISEHAACVKSNLWLPRPQRSLNFAADSINYWTTYALRCQWQKKNSDPSWKGDCL